MQNSPSQNPDFSIQSKRLKLRRFRPDDAERVMEFSIEPSSKKWLSNQICESLESAQKLLDLLISQYAKFSPPITNTMVFGIENLMNQQLIGHVGFSPFGNMMEIGYGVGESYQNRGFATEAVLEMTQWGFNQGQLQVIYGLVDEANQASRKVLEKSGYQIEKTVPGELYNKTNNCCIYSCSKQAGN